MSYMKQNNKRKQTPESAQYVLEIIFKFVFSLKNIGFPIAFLWEGGMHKEACVKYNNAIIVLNIIRQCNRSNAKCSMSKLVNTKGE